MAILQEEILNGGFDWHYAVQPGIAVSLDTTQFHSGSQSVLISYSGTGGDSGFYEYVPVKPNTQYTVSAWVKSEELQTANGPCISVSDAYDNTRYALTQETVGTTPWHRLESSFQTGPATELLAIRFTRDPGNTHIHGQFWIDEVSLRPNVSLCKQSSDLNFGCATSFHPEVSGAAPERPRWRTGTLFWCLRLGTTGRFHC